MPQISYRVSMPCPQTHFFEVELTIKQWQQETLDLKMPVWTPGSYLVREYARQVQNFSAGTLKFDKIAKNHWQIDVNNASEIVINYRVFANELTVRTNHLDRSHGYFNPAALCYYIPNFQHLPIAIEIVVPDPTWQVATALPAIDHHTFLAADFDTLVDSPFEIGPHQVHAFTVGDKYHRLVVWGEGNLDIEETIADIARVIEVEAKLFDGLPYEDYLFILHLPASGGGGLEHKNCCSLIYPQFNFQDPDKYHRFIQLVAHEFFHLWNVKRIRPIALQEFDYDGENYTPSLWFSEGTTSYYDLHIPRRAGIYNDKEFLVELSKEITRFLTTPGRLVQPLSESSFDAWIKLYRPDANSSNSQMSYYLKGEMVTLLLDLLIRDRSAGTRSFDDVMRQVWYEFGKTEIGFTEARLQSIIETVADTDLSDFYDRYIHGLDPLPFDRYLAPLGLELEPIYHADLPDTGMKIESKHGITVIKSVAANSPANLAGIDPGDELLAIDGFKITADKFTDRLKNYRVGDNIIVTIFNRDRLLNLPLTLTPALPHEYQLKAIDSPTERQQQLLANFLIIGD
jgi:predicted metalloprotease with PDZ domain